MQEAQTIIHDVLSMRRQCVFFYDWICSKRCLFPAQHSGGSVMLAW